MNGNKRVDKYLAASVSGALLGATLHEIFGNMGLTVRGEGKSVDLATWIIGMAFFFMLVLWVYERGEDNRVAECVLSKSPYLR